MSDPPRDNLLTLQEKTDEGKWLLLPNPSILELCPSVRPSNITTTDNTQVEAVCPDMFYSSTTLICCRLTC